MQITHLLPLVSKPAVRETNEGRKLDLSLLTQRTAFSSAVFAALGKIAGYTATSSFLLAAAGTATIEYVRTLDAPDEMTRLFERVRHFAE